MGRRDRGRGQRERLVAADQQRLRRPCSGQQRRRERAGQDRLHLAATTRPSPFSAVTGPTPEILLPLTCASVAVRLSTKIVG